MQFTFSRVIFGWLVICSMVFMFWYSWNTTVLSTKEIEAYLAQIEQQQHSQGGKHDLPALRHFLEHDDGRPFYTVNLYKYRKMASYSSSAIATESGLEAYERFSQVMIPLMLQRGSHPIFGSNWVDLANSYWDRIVIVRYRSRRDLVDIFATDDFASASRYKWASLQDHQRMIVQATHIPDGLLILALLLSIVAFALWLFNRVRHIL